MPFPIKIFILTQPQCLKHLINVMILKQVFWRTSYLAPFWIVEITVLAHLCTEGPFCQCPVGPLICITVLKDVNGGCYVEFSFFYTLGKSQLSVL